MCIRDRFDAIVTACRPAKHGFEVELSQTGFYPEGGGQPSDTGRIGEVQVTHVEEKHGVVVHETDAPLEVGSTVHAAIDWEQRFSNMQQHTGEHIISGLIHAAYGYDNVGFHMGHDEVTVDLNGPLNWEQLKEIEKKANAVVWANLPVQVTYPGEEELKTIDYRSKKELTDQVRICLLYTSHPIEPQDIRRVNRLMYGAAGIMGLLALVMRAVILF